MIFHPALKANSGGGGRGKDVESLAVVALDVQDARDGAAASIAQLRTTAVEQTREL
jgi:hypothetical protein